MSTATETHTIHKKVSTPEVIAAAGEFVSVTIQNQGEQNLLIKIDSRSDADISAANDDVAKFKVRPDEALPFIGFAGKITAESANHGYPVKLCMIASK